MKVLGLSSSIVVLAIASFAHAAEPKVPAGVAVYDAFPAAERPALIAGYQGMLKQQTARVAEAKRKIVRAVGSGEKESANKEHDSEKAYLRHLTDKNDPPAIGMCVDSWGKGRLVKEDLHSPPVWNVGAVGTSGCTFEVIQIVDKSTVIARRKVIEDWQTVVLKGWNTSKWTDQSKISFDDGRPLWVSGTTSYKNVVGTNRTVVLVEPFDWKRYRDEAAKKID